MLTKEQRNYIEALEQVAIANRELVKQLATGFFLGDGTRAYIDTITQLLASKPNMDDLERQEDYPGSNIGTLVTTMRLVIHTALDEERLTGNEARFLDEGLDYIQGVGQGL